MLKKIAFTAALLASAWTLTACAFEDESDEAVGTAFEGVGGTGANNVSPQPVDARVLRRSTTDSYGITTPSNADPAQLCKGGTITATGCTLKPEWETWLLDDASVRGYMMRGIAKCAVESSFTLRSADGSLTYAGQWGLYPGWKDGRLDSQDKRERMSSCILTLLNGNNATLNLCIIGPGGSPFSDACADPQITTREAGFFGDLFSQNPTAYVAGPGADLASSDGRACYGSQGSYCCAEGDTSCAHHIVRAGAILGSPANNYADKRCLGLATSGSFTYCTSFYSTREPGRVYANVFTTFVP